MSLTFTLQHTAPSSKARAGEIQTDHGVIHTPIFMPVGTAATVKGLFHRDVKQEAKAEIILAKHRNGAVGDVRLRFVGNYARFQNMQDESLVPLPEDAVLGSKMNKRGAAKPNDAYIGMPPVPPPPADNPFPMGGVQDMPF